ncbi:MAG TPA: IPT/TIG domain-containing protein [Chitinophaga sp.]|uniref:IPT/TIG domain-containing protein n=1 Tax=Chitinophaga sp. TaxID=1869181 RepID=UPI002C1C114F|nr:IPT/TIG domain-containing protein [Chitinophaga sp.]HVI43658.1 IPT/TIG domain-containing protein [Chitinophaga sp.]
MKHCRMFVVALTLLFTALSACTSNDGEKDSNVVIVTGNAGNYLMIKGHGFSDEKGANKVIFGEVPAQVMQATADYLLVQVPLQKADTVPVVVTVGENISNAMLFQYNPKRKLVAALKDMAEEAF